MAATPNPGTDMNDMTTIDTVRATLAGIPLPDGGDLVSADRVRALRYADGTVRMVIEAASADEAARLAPVKAAAEAALGALPGVSQVQIALSAPTATPTAAKPATPPDLGGKAQGSGCGGGGGCGSGAAAPAPEVTVLPGVARILLVGSGKGGVGKSTVAVNLAVAMAREGWRVGLLDADIYGPSVPRMTGANDMPDVGADGSIRPLEAHGVKLMSLGLLIPADTGVIWRGPVLQSILNQFMTQVEWGELDILIVDMPPGTGDVQMTLSKDFDISGALVVSTPQDVALLDARKAVDAFAKLDVDVVGLVENMAHYICPTCGDRAHLFGDGGVRRWADEVGLPLLAELPLTLEVRIAGDSGVPVATGEGPLAEAYRGLARTLIRAAEVANARNAHAAAAE